MSGQTWAPPPWFERWRRALVGASLATLLAQQAAAQGVKVQGGSSSLYGAHGGSIDARGATSTLTIGAGRLHEQWVIGTRVRKRYRSATFTAGDDSLDFQLPTDIFGGGRYVPVRGAGVDLKVGALVVKGFAGATANTTGAPFFQGATWGRTSGMLFVDRSLSPHWRVVSRNVIAARVTSIHSLEWQPEPSLKLAIAGGIGAGHRFGASSATIDRRWLAASAAYVTRDSAFRRIDVDSPMAAEVEADNLSLTIKPQPSWSVNAGRQHMVDNPEAAGEVAKVTVHSLGGNVNARDVRLSGGLFHSEGRHGRNVGLSLTAGHTVNRLLDVALDYFTNVADDGFESRSVGARLQQTISPRVSLLQVVSRSGKQTSFNVGGGFISNPLTIDVSYQTVYAPFREGSPFVQALAVDMRVQLPWDFLLQAGTYTTPRGEVRYTVTGSRFLSRASHGAGGRSQSFKFQKFLVRGLVRDEGGRPVAGAVLRLGDEVVVTGEDGRYFLRTNSTKKMTLAVLLDEFLNPGRFDVVSAPSTVTPVAEDRAADILIVVRRG